MADSLAGFFSVYFGKHVLGRAYGRKHGYRMEWWSYAEVRETAFRIARELQARKIGKGERVMLWGENSAEWVATFFGCAMCGVVVVPMDHGASADFARRVSRQVGAKLLICSREHLQQHSSGTEGADATLILEDFAQMLAHLSETPISNVAISPDEILEIVFTSGTTAEPKGVVITHGNVLANIAPLEREMQRYLRYERIVHPIRFLNLLPLSHVFGQFLGIFLPPLLGATVIFQEELKPSEIMSTVRRERVSVLVSVPRVLQSLRQKIERDVEDRRSIEDFRLRYGKAEGQHFLRRWWTFRRIHHELGWKFWAFISGGAALDQETEQFWGRLGYAVVQGYGLTETTSLISVNHPFKLGKGSIGKVLPGREVKLADDGEILVRGGGVTSGYWDGSGRHLVAEEGGWYRTGDTGALDEAGNLYFKGRKKEVIVTPGGLNIYPEDLEAALRRQPEVKDCVVVGIERDGNAEPCAVVILRGDGAIEAVVERANQSLAEYQRMRISLHWPQPDFPRTNTQKPRRSLIQEVARKLLLQPASESAQSADRPLAQLISRITGRSIVGLRSDAKLDSDLGLSSLDRVELISALEDRFQIDLSETRFSAARSVGDVERMLRGEGVQRAAYHYPDWVLRWPATWVRFLAHYLLLRPAIMLLGWPRVEGRENLRETNGPLLVVANHIDDVDVGFIQTALPARFRHRLATAAGGEALEALRTPPPSRSFFEKTYDRMQWILGVSLLNLFPLPREAGFRQSFAYAGRAVDRGYSVLVFPEGRHTADGNMNPFRAGIGLLTQNLGIPVLPIRILGLFEVKQAGRRFAAPWQISVRIGQPIRFESGTAPEEIARILQEKVRAL
jgi:long-chain acyl-CoA synthetase